MRKLSPDTSPRPRDLSQHSEAAVLYVRSYLLIRTVVGVVGILLPIMLIVGDSWALGSSAPVRGSLSDYYHTPMQDVFVGTLCIIAVLLATYLAGQPWTWDFWLSLGAGVALLGVVFFPVGRSGLAAGAPRCGGTPQPLGCSLLEQLVGEGRAQQVHEIAAGGCFLLLAALSFLFARRERLLGGHPAAALLHGLFGVVILLGIAAAGIGSHRRVDLGPIPLLYAGETATVWAFGASWLLAGRDLWLRLLRPRRSATAEDLAVPDWNAAAPLAVDGGGRRLRAANSADGALVDMNVADAAVIAQVCGIDQAHADAVVAARAARGGLYVHLGELLLDVVLPPEVQARLSQRAFV